MEAKCPQCGAVAKVAEEDHYRLVKCPSCGKKFQAFSPRTETISKDFLDRVLSNKSRKDPS